jgi:hypothetical protein
MFWFSGTSAVPVFVVPENVRAVIALLVGLTPPNQLFPVFQLTFPPLPFQIQLPA